MPAGERLPAAEPWPSAVPTPRGRGEGRVDLAPAAQGGSGRDPAASAALARLAITSPSESAVRAASPRPRDAEDVVSPLAPWSAPMLPRGTHFAAEMLAGQSPGSNAFSSVRAANTGEAPGASPRFAPPAPIMDEHDLDGGKTLDIGELTRFDLWTSNFQNVPKLFRLGLQSSSKKIDDLVKGQQDLRKDVDRIDGNVRKTQEQQVAQLDSVRQSIVQLASSRSRKSHHRRRPEDAAGPGSRQPGPGFNRQRSSGVPGASASNPSVGISAAGELVVSFAERPDDECSSEEEACVTMEERKRWDRVAPLEKRLVDAQASLRQLRGELGVMQERQERSNARVVDMWGRMKAELSEGALRDQIWETVTEKLPGWLTQRQAEDYTEKKAKEFLNGVADRTLATCTEMGEKLRLETKTLQERLTELEAEVFERSETDAGGGGRTSSDERRSFGRGGGTGRGDGKRRLSFSRFSDARRSVDEAPSIPSDAERAGASEPGGKGNPSQPRNEARACRTCCFALLPNASFCPGCGKKVLADGEQQCSVCGEPVEPGAALCEACGKKADDRPGQGADSISIAGSRQGSLLDPTGKPLGLDATLKMAHLVGRRRAHKQGSEQETWSKESPVSSTGTSRWAGRQMRSLLTQEDNRAIHQSVVGLATASQELASRLDTQEGQAAVVAADIQALRVRDADLAAEANEVREMARSSFDDAKALAEELRLELRKGFEAQREEFQTSVGRCIEELRAEATRFREQMAVIFPRAITQTAISSQFNISEARLFGLDSRLNAIEDRLHQGLRAVAATGAATEPFTPGTKRKTATADERPDADAERPRRSPSGRAQPDARPASRERTERAPPEPRRKATRRQRGNENAEERPPERPPARTPPPFLDVESPAATRRTRPARASAGAEECSAEPRYPAAPQAPQASQAPQAGGPSARRAAEGGEEPPGVPQAGGARRKPPRRERRATEPGAEEEDGADGFAADASSPRRPRPVAPEAGADGLAADASSPRRPRPTASEASGPQRFCAAAEGPGGPRRPIPVVEESMAEPGGPKEARSERWVQGAPSGPQLARADEGSHVREGPSSGASDRSADHSEGDSDGPPEWADRDHSDKESESPGGPPAPTPRRPLPEGPAPPTPPVAPADGPAGRRRPREASERRQKIDERFPGAGSVAVVALGSSRPPTARGPRAGSGSGGSGGRPPAAPGGGEEEGDWREASSRLIRKKASSGVQGRPIDATAAGATLAARPSTARRTPPRTAPAAAVAGGLSAAKSGGVAGAASPGAPAAPRPAPDLAALAARLDLACRDEGAAP